MAGLSERRTRGILSSVGLGSFAILLALEFVSKGGELTLREALQDAASLLLTVTAAVGMALLVQRVRVRHEEGMALTRQLEIARNEGEAWRAKVQAALVGLKAEMERQFHCWAMTSAERDVGLLILKGLSHNEIATLRGTSEATVRKQAHAIYKKSHMPGKTAFCAYFLEDLFAPATTNGNGGADPSEVRRRGVEPGRSADLHA